MLTFSGPVTYRTPQVLTLNHYSSGPAYILPIYQPVYLTKYHPRCLSIEPFTKGLIPKVTHCIHVYFLLDTTYGLSHWAPWWIKPILDSLHHHCIESNGAHTSLVITTSRIAYDTIIVQTNESIPPKEMHGLLLCTSTMIKLVEGFSECNIHLSGCNIETNAPWVHHHAGPSHAWRNIRSLW